MGIVVKAKSIYPNHTHRFGNNVIKFDNRGFFETTNSKLIYELEKHSGKRGYWSIIETKERTTEYKGGTPRGKSYLVADAIKLGFQRETGINPFKARVEQLIEYINYKRG